MSKSHFISLQNGSFSFCFKGREVSVKLKPSIDKCLCIKSKAIGSKYPDNSDGSQINSPADDKGLLQDFIPDTQSFLMDVDLPKNIDGEKQNSPFLPGKPQAKQGVIKENPGVPDSEHAIEHGKPGKIPSH